MANCSRLYQKVNNVGREARRSDPGRSVTIDTPLRSDEILDCTARHQTDTAFRSQEARQSMPTDARQQARKMADPRGVETAPFGGRRDADIHGCGRDRNGVAAVCCREERIG